MRFARNAGVSAAREATRSAGVAAALRIATVGLGLSALRDGDAAGERGDIQDGAAVAEHAMDAAVAPGCIVRIPVTRGLERQIGMDGPAERACLELEPRPRSDGQPHVTGVGVELVAPALCQVAAVLDVPAHGMSFDALGLDVLDDHAAADAAGLNPARIHLAQDDVTADALHFDAAVDLRVGDFDVP